MNFKQAYLRLQEIHQLLKSEELIDIDMIINLQKEAKECHDICNTLLQKTQENEKAVS